VAANKTRTNGAQVPPKAVTLESHLFVLQATVFLRARFLSGLQVKYPIIGHIHCF